MKDALLFFIISIASLMLLSGCWQDNTPKIVFVSATRGQGAANAHSVDAMEQTITSTIWKELA
jgi:hypothetical protein